MNTIKVKQPAFPHQNDCKTRKYAKTNITKRGTIAQQRFNNNRINT